MNAIMSKRFISNEKFHEIKSFWQSHIVSDFFSIWYGQYIEDSDLQWVNREKTPSPFNSRKKLKKSHLLTHLKQCVCMSNNLAKNIWWWQKLSKDGKIIANPDNGVEKIISCAINRTRGYLCNWIKKPKTSPTFMHKVMRDVW